jgi:hypothetical protein
MRLVSVSGGRSVNQFLNQLKQSEGRVSRSLCVDDGLEQMAGHTSIWLLPVKQILQIFGSPEFWGY